MPLKLKKALALAGEADAQLSGKFKLMTEDEIAEQRANNGKRVMKKVSN